MAGHPNLLFSILSFLGFVLLSICLPWNMKAWNTGACCYIIWTALTCLTLFINSVVWEGSVSDVAPIWCDISAKLIIGISSAIPAASLCMDRRLYLMISKRQVAINKIEKRRVLLEDLAIGVGIPVLQMIVHYIPQGHRYDIAEDLGCSPSTYNTWVAYVLFVSWPLVIGVVDAVYCVLNLIHINRKANADLFVSDQGDNALDKQRYWRLMIVSIVASLTTLGFSSFFLAHDLTTLRMSPWISWEDTHFHFSHVGLIPALIWRNSASWVMALTRWIVVICAFLFFAIFGTSKEAIRNYRAALLVVCGWFKRRELEEKEPSLDQGSKFSSDSIILDISLPSPTIAFDIDLERASHEGPRNLWVNRSPVNAPASFIARPMRALLPLSPGAPPPYSTY
ncbi:hypothetical protein E1B28_008026 [Marasmius oreades]|uniref:Pheromone receptor n=1 Tax=Marasmius oreades TaxID=181124 RepID=A0A9P7UVJ1_9AGAR|nr:uncharacterized protein E1B28_008026 [Marasmius oreades]KAG7094426.1 hypothetical protein E1B28_008026 [Marasmius oreades]